MVCRLVGASHYLNQCGIMSIGPRGTNFNDFFLSKYNTFIQEYASENVVWKMVLLCNDGSHWLGASFNKPCIYVQCITLVIHTCTRSRVLHHNDNHNPKLRTLLGQQFYHYGSKHDDHTLCDRMHASATSFIQCTSRELCMVLWVSCMEMVRDVIMILM